MKRAKKGLYFDSFRQDESEHYPKKIEINKIKKENSIG